jgi:hypothetical protein
MVFGAVPPVIVAKSATCVLVVAVLGVAVALTERLAGCPPIVTTVVAEAVLDGVDESVTVTVKDVVAVIDAEAFAEVSFVIVVVGVAVHRIVYGDAPPLMLAVSVTPVLVVPVVGVAAAVTVSAPGVEPMVTVALADAVLAGDDESVTVTVNVVVWLTVAVAPVAEVELVMSVVGVAVHWTVYGVVPPEIVAERVTLVVLAAVLGVAAAVTVKAPPGGVTGTPKKAWINPSSVLNRASMDPTINVCRGSWIELCTTGAPPPSWLKAMFCRTVNAAIAPCIHVPGLRAAAVFTALRGSDGWLIRGSPVVGPVLVVCALAHVATAIAPKTATANSFRARMPNTPAALWLLSPIAL